MARPVTNHDLDALLTQAGYALAHGAFARQVNHAIRDRAASSYDAASVYWWLRGRRPEEAARTAIAAVLARKLQRPVTVNDLGFGCSDASVGLVYPPSPSAAIKAATDLWRLIVHRRDVLTAVSFVTTAALDTGFAWRYDSADADLTHLGTQRVAAADVKALRIFTGQFAELDRRYGSGSSHTRVLMTDFLHQQVTPMLHGSYTDTVGRDLMNAASTLTGQLAFMSYDAGEHGLAQRHFTTALRLAKAANDQLHGAHLVANLATQALYLGHTREAVRLARAATDGAGRAPAAVLARLHATEAIAHATAGDRQASLASLHKATKSIERSHPDDAPPWASYFTPAHFAGTAIRCFRYLRMFPQAFRHGPAALDLGPHNVRTRTLHTILLATTHAEAGGLDAACELGVQALALADGIQSSRVRKRLMELGSKLAPHQSATDVAQLLHALRALPAA